MADQVVNVTVKGIGDFSDVAGKVKDLQGVFNKLKLNPELASGFTKEFNNLQKLLNDYNKLAGKEVTSKKDIKNMENLEKAINSSFSTLNKLYGELGKQTILTNVDSSKLDELRSKTQAAQKELQNVFANINVGSSTSGLKEIENSIEKAVGRSKTLKNSFSEVFSSLSKSGNIQQFTSGLDSIFENLNSKLRAGKLQPTIDSLLNSFKSLGLVKIDMPLDSTAQKLLALKTGFDTLKTAIVSGVNGDELKVLIQNLETATKAEKDFQTEAEKRGKDVFDKQASGAKKLADATREGAAEMRNFKQQSLSATTQLEQLQSSTQYFFGLRNMINLLKRGVREAIDTVKELDKAMTETAVVTKFDVSDMWAKLPEYTANANALGATVQDMYEATTLYYQQGLNAEQAMSIASETMKMARIGGLEAAEATDMMTAALRGFNMELNETSAQRINDVYSNLAAKTASNTEELGNAMQRTASIAANAGMSFEGTAAFLAQAIETTREPAENIGTAMKTIIARMQEMKKNPLEIGEVDGEEVDYNKIDAALKSVGISIKKANGDFRDNDDILLDISKSWDTLSQTQQRYIATTIAGSRQQSRFIAMVGDYDRTMELMGYANDSSGASNEQFGKTLDSLEAKLNKFQNAWKQFLMNIMNDSWTKGIVTGTTKVLDVVNKLINTLSFGGQAKGIKSFLSLFTAFTALKYAGRGVNMLIGGLGGMMDPNSTAREGLRGGALGGQAARISNPIVQAINNLIPHIDKSAMALQYNGYGNFKGAKNELMAQFNPLALQQKGGVFSTNTNPNAGKYSFSSVLSTFSNHGVNPQQQNAILASVPGLKHNMTKSLAAILKDSAASPEATKGLIAGFKNGSYSTAQILEKAGFVRSFSAQMAHVAEKEGPEAAKSFMEAERKAIIKAEGKAIAEKAKSAPDFGKYYNSEVDKRLQSRVYATDKGQGILEQERELTKSEKLANSFGKVGGALTSAGMSLQMFGSALSTTNPMLGQLATTMGTVLSTMGAVPNMISSIVAGGPGVWALTAAAVALGGALALIKKRNNDIKKSAEEVNKAFQETKKQTEANVSTLKQYREQMATLSKGVDANGNNVSLSDEDYAHYLEMVDKIAELNPKIVQGYNAQGHAIIDNNKALEETIRLQEENQKLATERYIEEDSLQKLINARNIDKDYKKGTQTTVDTDFLIDHRTSRMDNLAAAPNLKVNRAPMQTAVSKVISEMQQQDKLNIDEILSGYNISLEQLTRGEAAAINTFVKNQDQISSQVGAQLGSNMNKSLTEAFTQLGEQTTAFDEAVAPVVQNLQTYASNLPAFKNIGTEFQAALMSGLKDIAIQPDLDASEMHQQAQVLIQEFDNLTREGSDYSIAMKSVEEAQNQFAASLDASEYADNTKDALTTLDALLKQYEHDTTAYGQAVAEYLQNQINKIQKFTEEGTVSLTESLNKRTAEITAAEGAYKAFQDATKSDLSTGKDSMKSIYDEITKDTNGTQLHLQGSGDNTLWTGMSALFSQDAVDQAAEEGTEAVQRMLNRIKPMLEDGQKGFDAFWTDMFSDENYEKLKEIEGVTMDKDNWEIHWDDNLNPDVFKEMADALGWSDQFLASMLNSGRQFANLDFMNVDDVRKALSTDSAVIKGTSTSTITRDDGSTQTVTDMFVTEDYLKEALRDAQIVNPQEQKEYIENILKDGVQIIPGPKDITEDTFQHMGISDLPGLIRTLGDTGRFDRSQIAEYAQQMSNLGLIDNFSDKVFDTDFQDYLNSQEHPELPTISNIDGNVASIASMIATQNGYVTQQDKDAYEQANKDTYGELGKADSLSEMFSLGKNANGENLTADEYNRTLETLNKQAETYGKQAEHYIKQAEKAEANGNYEDAEWFRKHAEGYEKKQDDINAYVEDGKKAFAKIKQEADDAARQKEEDQKKKESEGNKVDREGRDAAKYRERQEKSADARGLTDFATTDANVEKNARDKSRPIIRKQEAEKQDQVDTALRREYEQLAEQIKERNHIADEQNTLEAEKRRQSKQEIDDYKAKQQEKANAQNQADSEMRRDYEQLDEQIKENKEKEAQDKRNQHWQTKQAKVAQVEAVDERIESLASMSIKKNLNTSLTNALQKLDASTIAKDPQQNQALTNLYRDIISDRMPKAKDLQDLEILGELDSEFISKLPDYGPGGLNTGATLKLLTSELNNILDFITETDKTCMAMDVISFDTVGGAIDKVQTWLNSCYERINGIEVPEMTSTINEGSSTVASIAQGAISATFGIEVEGGEQIEEVTTQAEGAADIINQGAKFVIDVSGERKLKTAADKADKLTKNQGTKNFGVTTSFDSKAVTTGIQAIKNITDTKITVGANADPAYREARSVANQIRNITTTLSVYMHQAGSWNATVYVNKSGPGANLYTGANNKISYHHVPEAGSLAGGTKKGRVGPRNQGGMTLTGELGYEIAWLPEENRSVILGANGPQMVNLPKSAVVYNHDQSKEIMKKRKGIGAGSMEGGSYNPNGNSSGGGSRTTNSSGSGKNKKIQDKEDKNADDAAKVIAKAGWVQVWWENMTRRVDATQKKVDNSLSLFEKKIKTFGTTVTSIKSTVDAYRKNLKHSIALNQKEVNQAKYELKQLTNPNSWYNRKEVSYEETTGDKKETKKMTIKLANYIKYNQQEGIYEIRQDMLDKIGLKGWTDGSGKKHPANQSLAQAVKDAVEKEINDRNSKLKIAEDNIKKAQEALEKLSNDVYQTFDAWKKSINQVYLLSQKLQVVSQQLSNINSKLELQYSKMEAGITTATTANVEQILDIILEERDKMIAKAQATQASLEAKRDEYRESLSLQPYLSALLRNPDSTDARNKYEAAVKALNFLKQAGLDKDGTFNYNTALNMLNSQKNQMTETNYNAVKEILDGIFETQNTVLGEIEAANSIQNEIYQQMEEYQTYIADFEESLLSGMEAQAEEEIKQLDKLNSSLTKAYKEILDEVKNKLDERRKKEDNEKTESDIAKKQQRLATLRADTSGGHAVEIAQLEKEISDARRDYQRNLEDQLLDRLQHQNDLAEKQRQQQIDLLQAHVDVAKNTDTNLTQVKEWLANPEQYYNEIRSAWLQNQHYNELPEESKKQLEEQWEVAWAKYRGYSAALAGDKIEGIQPFNEVVEPLTGIEQKVEAIAKQIEGFQPTKIKDLLAMGYKAPALKTAGITATTLKNAGISAEDALKAGFSGQEVAKAYGGAAALRAGVSGKDVQAGTGWLAATVQKSIRDNSKDKDVSQTDMSGVSVKIDINGKGKGGVVSGTITKGGKYAYANDGSTLYGQAWDPNTGKLTGSVAKTTIDRLDVKHIQATKEAKEALIYAIQHTAPGAVINKKFKALAEAAGIVGKKYKLSNNIWGSIGSTGEIVYNKGKEGVYLWNPATGKQKFEKYNAATFKKKAKYKTVGSEYADVLKANGIKKFATGGLADYTGPAWLDGTPAKPELILNATDTKNFIALKDVLSKAIGSTHAISNEYGGDTTFEININVDHIANDYDVDKMAERVKKIIVKDSSYRNVTQVRKFR